MSFPGLHGNEAASNGVAHTKLQNEMANTSLAFPGH